jgi:transposase
MLDENKRLEMFRTLRSEIRGSKDYLVVGIDVAKDKHYALYGTATGEVLRRGFVFRNDRKGFDYLCQMAETLKAQHGLTKVVFGLEPTGVYHKPLQEYLIQAGEMVVLVSNVAAARNRELLDGRWDKNDASCSGNVGDLVGQGRCLYADFPEEPIRELRGLVSIRARLRKQEHALRMRIRNNWVAHYFPELDAAYGKGGSDLIVLAILREGLFPPEIAQLDYESFWGRVTGVRWGKRQQPRMRAIWKAAKHSIGCSLTEAARWEGPRLAHRLDEVRQELGEVAQKMVEVAEGLPGYRSVISIPGIGPVLAAMILAAIGDPHRFNHPRQVLRLAGLDLCASRSGKQSERAIPKISGQGKPMLRYALVQAAKIAPRSSTVIGAYYERLLQGRDRERGIRLKMWVKLASKLLVTAWTLMKRNETFEPKKWCLEAKIRKQSDPARRSLSSNAEAKDLVRDNGANPRRPSSRGEDKADPDGIGTHVATAPDLGAAQVWTAAGQPSRP